MKSIVLKYSDLEIGGTSCKEYRVHLLKNGHGYLVNFEYGRQGGTLAQGTKTKESVPLKEAEAIFDKLIQGKMSNGYKPAKDGATPAAPAILTASEVTKRTPYPQEKLEEISRESAEDFLKDDRYLMQVKANGHFRQVEKTANGYLGYNKKGESVAIPAELAKTLDAIALKTFFIEGELVGDNFYAFNLLSANGADLARTTYNERWLVLDDKASEFTVDTWHSTAQKKAALAMCEKEHKEGVAFKRKDALYRAGESGQHFKFKFLKEVTCKVVRTGDKGHNSATLALLDGKKWIEVGKASLNGKDTSIKVGSLVEIIFLYATEGRRLYQPRIKELRDDVRESECTMAQLEGKYQEGVEA